MNNAMNEPIRAEENVLHFTGSLSLSEPLEVDKSYRFGIEAECFSKEKRSKQDSNKFELHFKCRIVGGEMLKDNGEIIKLTKKNSPSKKLRFAIQKQCELNGQDFQEVYEKKMMKIIAMVINNEL